MKKFALLALISMTFAHTAFADTLVACTFHKTVTRYNGTTKDRWSSYVSPKAPAGHDWQSIGASAPGGPFSFERTGNKYGVGGNGSWSVPAGDVCAIFRDGKLDKADPYNIATGVAETGLPNANGNTFTWPF